MVRYREAAIDEWILSQEVHPIEPAEEAPDPEGLDVEDEHMSLPHDPDLQDDAA